MSAVLAFFARLPWWAWVGVALLAVLGWQWLMINRLESALSEEEEAHIATTTAFTTYRANVESLATAEKLARQQREDAYRDREAQITRDADKRIQAAADAARAVRADADRVRQQAARIAAAARSGTVEAATTAADSAASEGRAAVLADVFGRCVAEVAELAIVADRARLAGAECEARYDSAGALTGN